MKLYGFIRKTGIDATTALHQPWSGWALPGHICSSMAFDDSHLRQTSHSHWRFPKMGVPLNHLVGCSIINIYKLSSDKGVHHGTPIYRNPMKPPILRLEPSELELLPMMLVFAPWPGQSPKSLQTKKRRKQTNGPKQIGMGWMGPKCSG